MAYNSHLHFDVVSKTIEDVWCDACMLQPICDLKDEEDFTLTLIVKRAFDRASDGCMSSKLVREFRAFS
jgi:hypothetical protein